MTRHRLVVSGEPQRAPEKTLHHTPPPFIRQMVPGPQGDERVSAALDLGCRQDLLREIAFSGQSEGQGSSLSVSGACVAPPASRRRLPHCPWGRGTVQGSCLPEGESGGSVRLPSRARNSLHLPGREEEIIVSPLLRPSESLRPAPGGVAPALFLRPLSGLCGARPSGLGPLRYLPLRAAPGALLPSSLLPVCGAQGRAPRSRPWALSLMGFSPRLHSGKKDPMWGTHCTLVPGALCCLKTTPWA